MKASAKYILVLLVILLVFSVITTGFLIYSNQKLSRAIEVLNTCNSDLKSTDYELLSPSVAWLNAEVFNERQQYLTVSYAELKDELNPLIRNADGDYAVYFEDLTTGAWMGIDEKEDFFPYSLLKIPVMIATLKRVESGDISLDQTILLKADDLNPRSGVLWQKGEGYNATVKELLSAMIQYSDNTAVLTLMSNLISESQLKEAYSYSGIDVYATESLAITPKGYSNMLRGLYFSNYLRRPFSEVALSIMLDSEFNSQLPSGVPKDIKIAHKVGFYVDEGYFHDCGIVYASKTPYILCVMSKNTTAQEADRVIGKVSEIVYEYVSEE